MLPIIGHSFIPPDRDCGNIEREIKKMPTTISPDEYNTVINQHSTVFEMGNVKATSTTTTIPIKTHRVITSWVHKTK